MILTEGQNQALEMAKRVSHSAKGRPTIGILAGYAGCHRKGQLILMFDGKIKAVEDIVVGDQLMGSDSLPRNVLSLCRGNGKMVQVTPTKGESFVVNEDHILTLDLVRPYTPRRTDVSIKEFLKWPKTKQFYSKLVRSTEIQFEAGPSLPIDPYLLGALLGDGGLTHRSVDITTISSKLLQEVSRLIKPWGLTANLRHSLTRAPSYILAGTKGVTNPLVTALKKLHLFPIACENRFIPQIYKTSNKHNRELILAGLMDTDGSINNGGYDYVSKSICLAEDVAFIARSLGLAAYVKLTYKECQTGEGGFYHRVFISGDTSFLPCIVRPNIKRKQIKSVLHTGLNLKYLGTGDYYGFSLDGDGRFLLGDFTITHNTGKTSMLKIIETEVGKIQVVTPTGKAALRVTEATGLPAITIHRWLYKPNPDPFTGGVSFSLKKPEEVHVPPSKLLVIDEASMVGLEVWTDLYGMCDRVGCNILAVGDPFQLPPVEVNNKTGFSLLETNFKYDERVELTEVLRQALESPIIRASMEVRNGDALKAIMELPIESRISDPDFLKTAQTILDEKGVIIAHQNKTRHLINNLIRKSQGKFELTSGEPLLVLRNNYDLDLYNGEVVEFQGWEWQDSRMYEIYDAWKETKGKSKFGRGKVGVDMVDNGKVVNITQVTGLSVEGIKGGLDNLNMGAIEKVGRYSCGKATSFLHCNYGHCLTTHKSQGSQWPTVMVVIEPTINLGTRDGKRWLYTSLTRPEKTLYISWRPDFRGSSFAF